MSQTGLLLRVGFLSVAACAAFLGAIMLTGETLGQRDQPGTPVTKERALEIGRKAIADLKLKNEIVIQEEKTIERDFGWVFFATSKKYLETGDPGYLVPGIGPLAVDRADGSAQFLGTSVYPEEAIAEYERLWRENKKTK